MNEIFSNISAQQEIATACIIGGAFALVFLWVLCTFVKKSW